MVAARDPKNPQVLNVHRLVSLWRGYACTATKAAEIDAVQLLYVSTLRCPLGLFSEKVDPGFGERQ